MHNLLNPPQCGILQQMGLSFPRFKMGKKGNLALMMGADLTPLTTHKTLSLCIPIFQFIVGYFWLFWGLFGLDT